MRWREDPISSGGVLCCGSVVADVLVRPVSEPGWGKTTWVESIEISLGGNGASTSYTIARLGTHARLLSAVGTDDFGSHVLARLDRAGVDTWLVERLKDLPTATSVVMVHPDGRRALLHQPGASREAFPRGINLTRSLIAGYPALHLANIFGMPRFQPHAAAVLKQAREQGLSTSMDTAWDPQELWMQTLGPCLPYTGLLFVNEDEAHHLTGFQQPERAAAILMDHGATRVVVKLGACGCLVAGPDGCFRSPAFAVQAVDTTGAGDCFVGGFLAALQRGWDYEAAARFANAVGALSAASLGAVTGIRTFAETVQWMEAQ